MTEIAQPDAMIEVVGTVIGGGVVGPLFRLDDGRVFALDRFIPGSVRPGKRMSLRGRVALNSFCHQGEAFTVSRRLK